MITTDDMYFLSRPRRFGKTLMVSTLEAIFQGKRELFTGLYIASADYDWKNIPSSTSISAIAQRILHQVSMVGCREGFAPSLPLMEKYFAPYIEQGLKKTGMTREAYLEKVKSMYDGYRFHPRAETVYNPVSVGQFFSSGGVDFFGYWADTGNTKLLRDVAKRVKFNVLEDIGLVMDYSQTKNFDVLILSTARENAEKEKKSEEEKLSVTDLISLLYQTGYLTLVVPKEDDGLRHFDFPNTEVKESFTSSLLATNLTARVTPLSGNALSSLRLGKTAKVMAYIKTMLASVPYTIQIGEEKYYQSLLFMMFCSWGAKRIAAEEPTNIGRIDLVLEEDNHLYVIECKYGKSGKTALEQIKEKKYVEKYLDRKDWKKIHLLGIEFSPEERNIDCWEEETI